MSYCLKILVLPNIPYIFTKALHRLKTNFTDNLYDVNKGGINMTINDKVLYLGKIYKVIYDYQNGQYEIMKDDLLKQVHLVKKEQLSPVQLH